MVIRVHFFGEKERKRAKTWFGLVKMWQNRVWLAESVTLLRSARSVVQWPWRMLHRMKGWRLLYVVYHQPWKNPTRHRWRTEFGSDHCWKGIVDSSGGMRGNTGLWVRGGYVNMFVACTNLSGWGEGGAVTSVGWQITLCDPIDKWRPVVVRWISRRTIHSFTFYLYNALNAFNHREAGSACNTKNIECGM